MAIVAFSMTDWKELPALLERALSSENSVRVQAEQEIDRLTLSQGFLAQLSRYAYLNLETVPRSHRLLVLSVLKRKVILIAIEECFEVSKILMDLLPAEEDRPVASLSAAVISIIVSRMESIETENMVVSGFLSFFIKWLSDEFLKLNSNRHELNFMILFSELINHLPVVSITYKEIIFLMPRLFQLVVSDTPRESSCLAVNVLRELILPAISIRKFPLLGLIKETWEDFFPALSAALLTPFFSSKGEPEYLVRNRLTLGITALVDDMVQVDKWTRKKMTANVFFCLLTRIEADSNVYLETVGNDENDDDDAIIVIQQIAAKRWELLGLIVHMKTLRSDLGKAIVNNLTSFLNVVLLYTMLCDKEAEEWLSEANAFLRQEEEREDEVVWNVRDTAADFCRICVSLLGDGGEIMRALLDFLISTEESWKKRESILFVLEVLLRRCPRETILRGVGCHSQLLQILLEKDVQGPAIVSSRALSLMGILLAVMKRERIGVESLCASLIPQAIVSLSSSVPLLRAAACKLFHRLIPLVHVDDALTSFARGQEALFSLMLNEFTSGELLYMCLEVHTEWIARCHSKRRDVASLESYNNLFLCWRNHIRDPNMGELVVSLFGELITEYSGDEFLTGHFSWLADVLNSSCGTAEHCVVPFLLQILTCIFEKGSDEVARKGADCFAGALCGLLLGAEESSIISSASNCLAALLQRCPQVGAMTVLVAIPSMKKPFPVLNGDKSTCSDLVGIPTLKRDELQPHSFSSVLVTIVMKMLGEEIKEVLLMSVGRVLVAIAQNTTVFRDDEIERLIITIVRRLMRVRTDTVTQELVFPLAVLMKLHMHAFINVLWSSGILFEMFSVWLPKMSVFTVKEVLFHSCDALLDLLMQCPLDQRLCGQLLAWIEEDCKEGTLPLDVALFVAVGKGVLNLATPASLDYEEGEEIEEEMELSEEEDENEQEEDQESKVVEQEGVTGEVSHELRYLLQKVSPLVTNYGPAASVCFSRSELKKLSDLLDAVTASS
ncbi:hypothetical protein MOQ_003720 [Trypanosoma cruzi marinkellei]|uniref:Importin N-terminal domain-containing protein n=1 Tax=Trypanosoma cruzi marinkellei TaxID=85056 RepID=K2NC14_TRYCR|nr:hypothetical protein MOQ_003720 [Trypanosoma cruzi marinkellei]